MEEEPLFAIMNKAAPILWDVIFYRGALAVYYGPYTVEELEPILDHADKESGIAPLLLRAHMGKEIDWELPRLLGMTAEMEEAI